MSDLRAELKIKKLETMAEDESRAQKISLS